jgi:hypothetical protein
LITELKEEMPWNLDDDIFCFDRFLRR